MTFDGTFDDKGLSRRALLRGGAALAGGAAFTGLTGAPAMAADAAKPDRLTMLYATSEADSDAIKAALPAFKQAFGFDIALDTMPYNALQQKAFAELASESPYYDIMIVDTPWMPALTNKILPITDMILDPRANEGLDITDFIPKVFYDTAVYRRDNSALHFKDDAAIDPAKLKAEGFDIYGLPCSPTSSPWPIARTCSRTPRSRPPTGPSSAATSPRPRPGTSLPRWPSS